LRRSADAVVKVDPTQVLATEEEPDIVLSDSVAGSVSGQESVETLSISDDCPSQASAQMVPQSGGLILFSYKSLHI